MRSRLVFSLVLITSPIFAQVPEPGMTSPPVEIREWIFQVREMGDMRQFEMQRPIVLEFFATWCQPCRMSLPHLNGLAREHGDIADFIAISLEKPSVLKDFFTEEPFYNVAADLDGRTTFNYGVTYLPHVFLINTEGSIAWAGSPSGLHGDMIRMAADGEDVSVIYDFSGSAGPVDLHKINRDLLTQYKIRPVYRLEICESDPVQPSLQVDGNFLNIKAPLTQLIAYLCDIGSAVRISMDEFEHDPFILLKFSSEYIEEGRMKAEILDRLEKVYGFHAYDKEVEMEVRFVRTGNSGKLPSRDNVVIEGVESGYTVEDDRSIKGDNISIAMLCQLLEMRHGVIFEDKSGDTLPRDWKIPFMEVNELEGYLLDHYGLSITRSMEPVIIRRIDLEGE